MSALRRARAGGGRGEKGRAFCPTLAVAPVRAGSRRISRADKMSALRRARAGGGRGKGKQDGDSTLKGVAPVRAGAGEIGRTKCPPESSRARAGGEPGHGHYFWKKLPEVPPMRATRRPATSTTPSRSPAPARDDSDRLSLLDPTLRARICAALDAERHDEGDILPTPATTPRHRAGRLVATTRAMPPRPRARGRDKNLGGTSPQVKVRSPRHY